MRTRSTRWPSSQVDLGKQVSNTKKTSKPNTAIDRGPQINRGEIETKNLSECLKVDFLVLFETLFSSSDKSARKAVSQMSELGILKRMDSMAELILEREGKEVLKTLSSHPSDTARGWAAFIIGRLPSLSRE